jgi:hypothetical protein
LSAEGSPVNGEACEIALGEADSTCVTGVELGDEDWAITNGAEPIKITTQI